MSNDNERSIYVKKFAFEFNVGKGRLARIIILSVRTVCDVMGDMNG